MTGLNSNITYEKLRDAIYNSPGKNLSDPNSIITILNQYFADLKFQNGQDRIITNNATITNSDRRIFCLGNITLILPKLSLITHSHEIEIISINAYGSNDVITINTTGGELLEDVTTFDLYEAEVLTLVKANTYYKII